MCTLGPWDSRNRKMSTTLSESPFILWLWGDGGTQGHLNNQTEKQIKWSNARNALGAYASIDTKMWIWFSLYYARISLNSKSWTLSQAWFCYANSLVNSIIFTHLYCCATHLNLSEHPCFSLLRQMSGDHASRRNLLCLSVNPPLHGSRRFLDVNLKQFLHTCRWEIGIIQDILKS